MIHQSHSWVCVWKRKIKNSDDDILVSQGSQQNSSQDMGATYLPTGRWMGKEAVRYIYMLLNHKK